MIEWAGYIVRCRLQVRINYRCLEPFMAHQGLYRADVDAARQQMGRERVPQSMDTGLFVNAGEHESVTKRSLKRRCGHVPPDLVTRLRPPAGEAGREHKLPGELARGPCVFAVQGVGHWREARAAALIVLVKQGNM